MFFAVAEATPQDSPKASPRADRARGRKGERKTYCMYTAIYTYHHIYQQLTYSCRQAREGRAPGALSIYKPTVLFDDGQKKKLLEQVKEKGY